MPKITFQALAGASELGANAYLIDLGGLRVLLDAGAEEPKRQKNSARARQYHNGEYHNGEYHNGEYHNDWLADMPRPHLCWISHAHWDHLGALGPLKARFPRLPCLSSRATRELGAHALLKTGQSSRRGAGKNTGHLTALAAQLQVVQSDRYFALTDYLGHAERRAIDAHSPSHGSSDGLNALTESNASESDGTQSNATRSIDNNAAPRFRAMTLAAGHIPGARMLLVEVDTPKLNADHDKSDEYDKFVDPDKSVETDKFVESDPQKDSFRLLYASDFCAHDQPLVPGAFFANTEQPTAQHLSSAPVDIMIMEGVLATHREYDAIDYARELARLIDWLKEQPENAALIGAARLGSAAQIAYALSTAHIDLVVHQALKEIVETAIRAGCPQHERASRLAALTFLDERGCAQALAANRIVLAGGEQFERGSAAGRLLARVRQRPNARIAIINRAYPRSPAGKLLKTAQKSSKNDENTTKMSKTTKNIANLAKIGHFLLPNHAPRSQLIQAVLKINPARLILVHGHRSRLFSLKRAIEKAGYTGQIDVPENGEEYVLREDF